MVITSTLAHGAVREAMRLNNDRRKEMIAALKRTKVVAPATFRRFGEWFRQHRAIHENYAFLIVFGLVGRRRGAFSVFSPEFSESATGWKLTILHLYVTFVPGDIEDVSVEPLPVTISGHALERMFQRNGSIQWSLIRHCLAGATLLLKAAVPAFIEAGCRQCALPAENGLLVGQVIDGELSFRTYLPHDELQPKWQALASDLRGFLDRKKLAIETSALCPDDEAANELRSVLEYDTNKFLLEPYIPGTDPLHEAWRSRNFECR